MGEAPPSLWRIEWNGKAYRWEDLTVGHLGILAVLVGNDDWESLDPRAIDPGSGYLMAAYLLTVFLAGERTEHVTSETEAADVLADVLDEVSRVRAADLAAAVHV